MPEQMVAKQISQLIELIASISMNQYPPDFHVLSESKSSNLRQQKNMKNR